MKKILIIVIFQIMTLPIFCQDITIKRTAMVEIIKESRKCDSLKVAYFKQSKEFDKLIESNNKMFKDFDQTTKEKAKLQETLNTKEKQFKKLFQSPNNGWFVPAIVGITIGIVLGVSL